MSEPLRLILANMPLALLLAALVVAAVPRPDEPAGLRFLAWVLLLAVGVESVGTGMFHLLAPGSAATALGHQTSRFQYDIGIVNIAIGLVAIDSFQRSLPYKSAIAGVAMLFYAGVVIGQVPQVLQAPNPAQTSVAPLLAASAVKAVLLPLLLAWAWAGYKARSATAALRGGGSGGRI